MRFILFLLFVAMPFIEIALLIKLGSLLGFWPTIGIVVATALVGTYVLHAQGLATMRRMSQSIASGEPPVKPVVDGFFLAIAGAFLLTPGVITDAIGLLLLIPLVRHAVARWLLARILNSGTVKIRTYQAGGRHTGPSDDREPRSGPKPGIRPGPGSDGPVIDAEFEEIRKK